MATMSPSTRFSPGGAATLACLYEATAPKPGNVHPNANFDDLSYADFVASAVVIGPILERACEYRVGRTVLEAVRATQESVGTNTNLGTLLLLAPLAAVPNGAPIADGIAGVLQRLDPDDTRFVYEAIRLAMPGGLGQVDNADVHSDPPANLTLVDVMRLAAERDRVARQYINQFEDVLCGTTVWIAESVTRGLPLSDAIVFTHVRQIAEHGDSLIARKCGRQIADEARRRAQLVMNSGSPGDVVYQQAITELDAWLRADGHRRNPGTTADLVAAGLFVLLREGRLHWKYW
jgi:triphosphoribosyl-dephospho-CoA synthase